jgi:hypothetical protein
MASWADPPGGERGKGMPRAQSFRERVLAQFNSTSNREYLARALSQAFVGPENQVRQRFAVESLGEAMYRFGSTHGPGGMLVDGDPLAMRGSVSRSSNLIEELQHLNRSFYHQRVQAVSSRPELDTPGYRRTIATASGGPGRDASAGDEPLFYRMFEADSLRPPGLEHLNGPGPLWKSLEDRGARSVLDEEYNPSVALEDHHWSRAASGRTAEQAVAEYYGEDSAFAAAMGPAAESSFSVHGEDGYYDPLTDSTRPIRLEEAARTSSSGATTMQAAEASRMEPVCGWGGLLENRSDGSALQSLLGTSGSAGRFQRRERIPYWQRGGRRDQVLTSRWQSAVGGPGAEDASAGDLEETLGSGSLEFGGERTTPVFRMDMSRLRNPHGESYTSVGPRRF